MKHIVAPALAVVSAGSIATGVGMLSLPAGLVAAGLLGFALLYVAAYMDARRGSR